MTLFPNFDAIDFLSHPRGLEGGRRKQRDQVVQTTDPFLNFRVNKVKDKHFSLIEPDIEHFFLQVSCQTPGYVLVRVRIRDHDACGRHLGASGHSPPVGMAFHSTTGKIGTMWTGKGFVLSALTVAALAEHFQLFPRRAFMML